MSKEIDKRDSIIQEASKLLQTDGLNFSIDTLSSNLKISKKTIYLYFKTKEFLAHEIYQNIFKQLKTSAAILLQGSKIDHDEIYAALLILKNGYSYDNETFFNRFSLNEKIRIYIAEQLEALQNTIIKIIQKSSLKDVTKNKVFPLVLQSTLKSLAAKKENDNLIYDFITLLEGEQK